MHLDQRLPPLPPYTLTPPTDRKSCPGHSDLVVDVCRTLGGYFLHDVDRWSIVTAHTLVVTAEHALRWPQREHNVTGVWVVVAAVTAAPLGHRQGVEGHGGRLLAFRDAVSPLAPPQQDQKNHNDDSNNDPPAPDDTHEHYRVRANRVWWVSTFCLSCLRCPVCWAVWERGRMGVYARIQSALFWGNNM